MTTKSDLVKITDYVWEIPKSFRADMRVPARIYADEKLLEKVFSDKSLEQLINVATLPGIVKYALAMPDMHEGYGFPIGGVAGFDVKEGIISPGGVGYDINCGVRVLRSELTVKEIQPYIASLTNQIQRDVPSGVGQGGGVKLNEESMKNVLERGVSYIVEKGYGQAEDIEYCEEKGAMAGAQASTVSQKAKSRGRDQLGTLGAGNHFLEIQKVDEIFDEQIAAVFGLKKDLVTIMIHCGSRGLGHQVATDYVSVMHKILSKYKISLADAELACAPFDSQEGRQYFSAMAASANFAWASRQVIMHLVRGAWQRVLGASGGSLGLIYDVAHNVAKPENYESGIMNQELRLIVHRKGATRAFPPGSPDIPEKYRQVGQPVLIPGTMGTASYILAGTAKAKETFFSVCHGAGRVLSRHAALRVRSGQAVKQELEKQGIVVRSFSAKGLAEEAPFAYKDIHNVVDVSVKAGLVKLVAKLKPLGVVKG